MQGNTGAGQRRLENVVAIVTGGGSGIGRATCLWLAGEGARVAVVDVDAERTEDTAKLIEAEHGGESLALALNVRREDDMEAMAARTLEKFGRIDILVHSAGILHPKGGRPKVMAELSTEEWDAVIETNLRGTFLANRAVVNPMIRQRGGQIINISSTLGRKAEAFESAYSASKFGVIGHSESLAEEVRPFGIKVMVVCPGAVATNLWEQNGPIGAPEFALPPERIANLIGYMLTLPPDTILQNVVVMPFKTRRRKKKAVDAKDGVDEAKR
ncbi:MAG: SDR family oxidoreductase [Deltaproteobacteria bacterium]|nr:SDR family oxidoreductase [Deltaproteobacteria bacterium]